MAVSDGIQFLRDLAKRQKEEGQARVQMYQEVGRVVVTLSEVEELLAEIYVLLSAPIPDEVSVKRFRKSGSIPRKLELVDEAVDRSSLVKHKDRWKALSGRVLEQKAARNLAAHASIEFHTMEGEEGFKVAIGTQLRHIEPREELYLSDVKASADALHEVHYKMFAFLKRLTVAQED